ncbi:MAG: hypothetical protein D6731_22900 [Planctomycetota bacterium]|nr:MAG: hypothetical protein D6731_22900 [Planctomycetota bacterium]
MRLPRLALAAFFASACAGRAAAQAESPAAFTERDASLDGLLEEALRFERAGNFEAAVAQYLEVEEALEALRARRPAARPTTEVGPGIDRSVRLYLRDRIARLPADAQALYRQTVDPRARAALENARATGSPAAIEGILARYPLSTVVGEALWELGAAATERGELGRAIRAYRWLESLAVDAPRRRKAALLRLHAAVARRDLREAEDALAAFRAAGGNADEPRLVGSLRASLAQRVASLPRAKSAGPARGFDPGDVRRSIPLEDSELDEDLVSALPAPPAYMEGVYEAERDLLYVCDEKTVRAIPLAKTDRGLGWRFSLRSDETEPSRVEVLAARPAVVGERVYATLHLNRPAGLEVRKEGEEEKLVVHRRRDWRVVALDARSGQLIWDAANRPGFEGIARDAEWVSPPLYHEASVFVSVLSAEKGNLRARLVRLDAAGGKVVYDAFIASRAAYDHLGLGTPLPTPAVDARGHVVVATGLGLVAALEPSQGEIVWATRYPAAPQGSQATLVLDERRFRAVSPLTDDDPIVVAPVDGPDLLAVNGANGQLLWRAPRGDARWCLAARDGRVLLLGERLTVLERQSGRILARGPRLPEQAIGRPALYADELLAPTAKGLLRIDGSDGRLLAQLRFREPREEAGACVPLGPGLLATIGYRRVTVFEDLATTRGALEERYAGRPVLWAMLGELYARRRDVEAGLKFLQRAVRSGITQTQRLRVQSAAVEFLSEEALAARARGDRRLFRQRARQVDYFLGALGARPDRLPVGRVQRDLLAAAAPVLRAYADDLAADPRPEGWPLAVRAYQRLLHTPPGCLVALDQGTLVAARSYAARRIRELVAVHGASVYEPFERAAQEELKLALAARSVQDLRKVIERYPGSTALADARWALAGLLEEGGLRGESVAVLRRFLREHPGDARRADALARLVLLEERLRRLSAAREDLDRLLALRPEPVVTVGGTPQPARAWAAAQRARLLGQRSRESVEAARALAGLDPPLRRVFRGPTELSQDGAELVALHAPRGPAGFYALRRGEQLELARAPDGERVLVTDAPPEAGGRLPPVLSEGLLVIPSLEGLTALQTAGPQAGRVAWALPVGFSGNGARIGPHPAHALAATEHGLVLLTGDSRLLGIDPARGSVRWERTLDFRASGGLVARGELVCAYSSSSGVGAAFSVEDGTPRWRLPAGDRPVRRGSPCWLGEGALVFAEDGQRLSAYAAADGKRRWTHPGDGSWILETVAAPDGSAVVVRTHGPAGAGLRAHGAPDGQVLWSDGGAGAARPGAPAVGGARATLSAVTVGEDAVYTARAAGGQAELWCQDLRTGNRRWAHRLAVGSRAVRSLETAGSVLVARTGLFGSRAALVVLSRGSGEEVESHSLPGRRFLGLGLVATGGVAVASTDRGVAAFAAVDSERLAEETVELARALEKTPTDSRLRVRLARHLELAGRRRAAASVLERGLLGESLRLDAFDRLFAELTSLGEQAAEEEPPRLSVRRMPRPPIIDGELSDWWRPWSSVDLRGPSFVQPIQQPPGAPPGRWTGLEDLSARLYLGWDEKNLYFALDVDDAHLRPYDSEAPNWVGDCLLIAVDCRGDGGDVVLGDDLLLSLALTLPKKKDDEEEQDEEKEREPSGKYFVRKKDDNSGAIYEAAIPWTSFAENGASVDPAKGPRPGFSFGFNVVLTDDDGDRWGHGEEAGPRGALKTLELTPGVLLHREKSRLWQGYVPRRFARITLR